MHLQTLLDGGAYGTLRRRQHLLHGRAADGDLQDPALPVRRLRVFTNKPPCGPKRGHGTPQPRFGLEVQLDKIAERLGIDPADLRLKIVAAAGHRSPPTGCRSRTIGLAECIERVVARLGLDGQAPEASRGPRPRASPARPTSAAPGCPSTGTSMPHSGVQLKLDRGGRRHGVLRRHRDRPGLGRRAGGMRGRGAGHRPAGHAPVAGDTDLTPVDLGLLLQPRHPDDGQRRHPGGRARARPHRRRRSRRSSRPAPRALVFAERTRLRRRGPGDAAITFAEAVVLAEARFGTHRHGRLLHAARVGRAGTRAAASGPPPPTRTRRAWSRCEVDPATGWIHVPQRLDRARHRPRLNPTLALGQVEGSVYMGAGRGADGGAGVPPPAAQAVARPSCTSSRRMLEYKSPTTLDMPEVDDLARRGPRPGRPVRRARRSGQGPLLPIMPAVAQRDLRRGRRARRRGADHARRRSWPRSRPARRGSPRATVPPRSPTSPTPSRWSCRRRRRAGTAEPSTIPSGTADEARPARRRRAGTPEGSPAMMRLPDFRYLTPSTPREAALMLAAEGAAEGHALPLPGGTDLLPNMKRRQQTPAVARGTARRRSAAPDRQRPRPAARAPASRWEHSCATPECAQAGAASGRPPLRSRRRTCGPWGRWAATSASTRAATTTTRPTSGGRRSPSA